MTAEIHGNGRLSLILKPTDQLEQIWFQLMTEAADKGSTVTVSMDTEGKMSVSVERG